MANLRFVSIRNGTVAGVVSKVDVHLVVAPVFATNTCVLAGEGGDAVIVHPGAGVAAAVIDLCRAEGLTPRAVVATHGHADHVWDAAALCEHFSVPFRINAADVYRLADPFGTLSSPGQRPDQSVAVAIASAVRAHGFSPFEAPSEVVPFGADDDDGGVLRAGSIELGLLPAPGHTEGSTLFLTEKIVFTGDVLFAGSIGRTDLPGGDPAIMDQTLRKLAKVLNPELGMIPGHGPASTVARELASNPYWLQAVAS
ncbi:MAG: MBL fold metallo-hydrolase [Promicromonosporaceae bacterium]|nr:MBL fold metallo-hydrolase [Promicromonosporaceae bacterium]